MGLIAKADGEAPTPMVAVTELLPAPITYTLFEVMEAT